jgi:hypothetical protein
LLPLRKLLDQPHTDLPSLWNFIVSLPAISMVDSFSALVLASSPHLLVKIDCLPLQPPHSPHFVMRRVKVHSSIVAKEICASASQPLKDSLDCATQFPSVQR